MKAILVLEDGTTYEGESIGAKGTTIGEVVFSTCMTGYQEMLTDPSYAGQILTLTYPLIGNYGVNHDDFESSTIQVEGFVVKHLCEVPSNWRAISTLNDFLKEQNVVGIQGVDTRALTRHLRIQGVMLGGITTDYTREEMLNKIANAPDYGGIDFTKRVTTKSPYVWKNSVNSAKPEFDVALLDFGVKRNILRSLCALNCRVTVYPCNTPAEQILDANPDGIILSPGPGDPALLSEAIENVKKLIGKKPIMGVCLGNQLLGWAFGSTTYKLKFGHRGGNHPVKELATGKVFITSQNHGYAVDPDGLKNSGMEVSHININDGTVEGLCHKELPIFSIQYHPEASPGPMDSKYLFQRFVEMLRNNK
ncbi:MAG: glutamine-hydrolyzing carbamoyl-phosphate synthase small subunit [Armatimonadetes bacterium]|nr:glutamine-hydrolyzing carbamoyl-phosphate synthase small subunit [Armatimonadota bacterium]